MCIHMLSAQQQLKMTESLRVIHYEQIQMSRVYVTCPSMSTAVPGQLPDRCLLPCTAAVLQCLPKLPTSKTNSKEHLPMYSAEDPKRNRVFRKYLLHFKCNAKNTYTAYGLTPFLISISRTTRAVNRHKR